MVSFAAAYATQNLTDYEAFVGAAQIAGHS
jgi:hypothetical protein